MRVLWAVIVWLGVAVAAHAQPLVDVEWLKGNLDNDDVTVIDLSGSRTDFLRAHIPGAVFSDYGKDGWRVKNAEGTPGMMAPVDKLEALIGSLGIGNDTHVVLVPAGQKALDVGTAARVYWTFKVLGHDSVSILDGGMAAWTAQIDEKTKKPVNPLDKGAVEPNAKSFKANLRSDMLVDKAAVEKARASGVVLVDNRPADQYLGINRHGAAKRSGTIPGALNLPENWLTENGGGKFRDKATLEKLFSAANVATTGEQINFCNTGHWAALGWFASHELMGNTQARMYDGSMLEWAGDAAMPIDQKVPLD